MISRTYIQANLRTLDHSYRKTSNSKHAYYFSKLAILELCGWIEMSMDDVIQRHCDRKISDSVNDKYVEREVIRKTYGFDYDKHFRQMLIKLTGIVTVEKIEKSIDVTVHALFKSQLTSLNTVRNSLAHTYTKQVGVIDAPSVTKARLQPIYDGLKAYDDKLRAL